MAAENKDPTGRGDHEWVILEGEEHVLRDRTPVHESTARKGVIGLLAWCIIIALLAIIAYASVMAPIVAERPWVGPWGGHEDILEGLIAGRAMKVRVVLKNSGRTPALNLRVAVRILISDPPPAASPVLGECADPNTRMPETVLFPDAAFSKTVASEQQIDDSIVTAVLHNDKTVYLTGCARYDDQLMSWLHLSPRLTQFCLMFVPTSAGNYGILGSFEDCPAGNTAN
jgi:hypothetical protein